MENEFHARPESPGWVADRMRRAIVDAREVEEELIRFIAASGVFAG